MVRIKQENVLETGRKPPAQVRDVPRRYDNSVRTFLPLRGFDFQLILAKFLHGWNFLSAATAAWTFVTHDKGEHYNYCTLLTCYEHQLVEFFALAKVIYCAVSSFKCQATESRQIIYEIELDADTRDRIEAESTTALKRLVVYRLLLLFVGSEIGARLAYIAVGAIIAAALLSATSMLANI